MAGDTVRRREEPFEAPRPAPRMDLSQMRPVLREQVSQALSREQQVAQQVMSRAFQGFNDQIARSGDTGLQRAWGRSSLKTLFG